METPISGNFAGTSELLTLEGFVRKALGLVYALF